MSLKSWGQTKTKQVRDSTWPKKILKLLWTRCLETNKNMKEETFSVSLYCSYKLYISLMFFSNKLTVNPEPSYSGDPNSGQNEDPMSNGLPFKIQFSYPHLLQWGLEYRTSSVLCIHFLRLRFQMDIWFEHPTHFESNSYGSQ